MKGDFGESAEKNNTTKINSGLPLLHLRRRGCREMGRCIHPESFLGKSNMSVEGEKTSARKHQQKRSTTAQWVFADFICRFLHRHSQHAQRKSERHPHTHTYWKTPCTPGCLACHAPQCWSSCLPVVVWAVRALVQERALAAADWSTGWQAATESEPLCTPLKPRDRNPTAFCMWHGRLECEWAPCWHSLLSHCYNAAGAWSKHTSWRSWYLPRLEAFESLFIIAHGVICFFLISLW